MGKIVVKAVPNSVRRVEHLSLTISINNPVSPEVKINEKPKNITQSEQFQNLIKNRRKRPNGYPLTYIYIPDLIIISRN